MSEEQTIDRLKALNVPAFVCQHLIKNPYLNLNFPCCFLDNNAWCDECEKFLQKEHGWTDKAVKFVDIQPYCRYCFAEMKSRYY